MFSIIFYLIGCIIAVIIGIKLWQDSTNKEKKVTVGDIVGIIFIAFFSWFFVGLMLAIYVGVMILDLTIFTIKKSNRP